MPSSFNFRSGDFTHGVSMNNNNNNMNYMDPTLSSASTAYTNEQGAAIYTVCAETNGGSAEELLVCLTQSLLNANQGGHAALLLRNEEYTRNMSLIFCAALVFFMQAGFAMVCAGSVRRKNLQSTMLKNLLDAAGSAIAFYAFGYAFAFGQDGNAFIGTSNFFLMGVQDIAFWVYQYTFSAASTTIVAGTLAERCQMSGYIYYAIMLSGFVYPVVAHIFWNPMGFLSPDNVQPFLGIGVLDIAGGGVVHTTGGFTALLATWILGPRRGRFHDEVTGELLPVPRKINGHNIGLQVLGTFILWVGWYGFNSGSALLSDHTGIPDILAVQAAANTTLAASAAGITAMLINLIWELRDSGATQYDLVITANGVLAGLVSITASCQLVELWASLVIGGIAGGLFLLTSKALVWCRLDDAVDAIPVHLVCGVWGLMSVGLFASPERLEETYGEANHPGLFYGSPNGGVDGTLFGGQICGALFIIAWTTISMLPFFILLAKFGLFRADAHSEVAGLDRSNHGGISPAGGSGIEELAPDQIAKLSTVIEERLRKRERGGSVKCGSRGSTGSVVTGDGTGRSCTLDV